MINSSYLELQFSGFHYSFTILISMAIPETLRRTQNLSDTVKEWAPSPASPCLLSLLTSGPAASQGVVFCHFPSRILFSSVFKFLVFLSCQLFISNLLILSPFFTQL